MANSYVLDMTEGNETKLLIKFAVPMLIGNIFQQFYNIVNSVVVGKFVGDTALAGVGIVGSLNFMFFSMCLGMAIGVGVIVSHYFGAKDETKVKRTIGNAIYLIGGIGMLMSILGVVLARPILMFLNTPDEVMPYALSYMRVLCGGIIFVAGYNGIAAILRAVGDSKTPLIFLIISSMVNVSLDLLFVVVLELGVAGAAASTVTSQAVAMIGSIVFALRTNKYVQIQKEHMKFHKSIFMQSVKIGIPVGLQNAFISFSIVALQRVVNGFGTTIMAAFTATGRVEQLINQPFNSIGAALSTFTGQNLGMGNHERVKRGVRNSMRIVITFSLFALIVFSFTSEWIVGCFVSNPESIALGAKALRITSLFYIALGTIYVTRGVLNGAGDGGFALFNGVIEVVGRVGFSMLFISIPMIGVWGVWITTGMTWFITGAAGMTRYLKGKWKNIHI